MLAIPTALFIQSAIAEPQADQLPLGYWPLEKSQPLIDKMAEVRLAPDLSGLSTGERIAVSKLLQAGEIFQALFEQQTHVQALSSHRALQELDQRLSSPESTQNLLTLYRLSQGPIIDTLENERAAFLPVELPPPGKSFYPWGITKEEVEAFLGAHPERRAALLDLRSVVRRADRESLSRDLGKLKEYEVLATLHPGLRQQLQQLSASPNAKALYAIPYSVACADEMMRVFGLLNEAAAAIEVDDGEFARFLRNRARDLLSDDYESGDAAWVTGRFKNLNAQIGAYEVYDDELYGTKTSLGLSLSFVVKRLNRSEKRWKGCKRLRMLFPTSIIRRSGRIFLSASTMSSPILGRRVAGTRLPCCLTRLISPSAMAASSCSATTSSATPESSIPSNRAGMR